MRTLIVLPRARQSMDSSASIVLRRACSLSFGSDGILEIEKDVVRRAFGRLGEHLRARARNRQLAPLQADASRLVPREAHRAATAGAALLSALRCGCGLRCASAAPILGGRANTAARHDLRHADIAHRHLGARDRAEQHQLVQIAEVADSEELAGHSTEAGAEREVVLLERGVR